jgi:hypothetical protein
MGWKDAPLADEAPKWASAPLADEQEELAQPSLGDQAKRQLGRTARIVAEGIGAFPLVAMDAGVAARNLLTGEDYDMPSKMYGEALDAAGLPRSRGAIEKGVDIAGQIIVGSKTPGPSINNPAPSTYARPASIVDDVIAQGEKYKVPVFFDDVTESAVAKKAGVAAENLGPIGTGSGRAAQAKAAQQAAQQVQQKLAVVGDDVPQMVQKGLQTRLDQFRTAADKLYTRAAQELDQYGNIKTQQFDDVLSRQIASQEKLGTAANQEVINTLKAYKDAPRGDFSLMRELRSQLSGEISKYYGGNKAIGDKGVDALQLAKEALDSDLASFAKQSGGRGFNYWKAADGFYKTNIAPFKEAGLKSLVKSPEPEKAWRFLVSQGALKSRSERMYRALDEPGRSAVRYGLVKDAMDDSINPNGSFSPARFARYMENHENAINTFFKGTELKEIQGFSKLMRYVERAGQFAENPPTGQRVIPLLMLGAASVEPTAAGAAAGSGLALKALFQTARGRDLLLAASKAPSNQMTAIYDQMGRFLASSTAVAASRESEEEQPQ